MSDPMTRDGVLAALADLGVAARTVEHPAVFTVAESRDIKAGLPGGHSKNLFVKDKKGRLFLVTAPAEAAIDLKRLHVTLGAQGRISFGSAELLREVLGVEPGSVTPLAAINDREGRVTVILDADLMAQDPVNVHPLVNTATTALPPADLVRFLEWTGHPPRILRLPVPEEADAA